MRSLDASWKRALLNCAFDVKAPSLPWGTVSCDSRPPFLGYQWFCSWAWQDCLSGIRNDLNSLMSFSQPPSSSMALLNTGPAAALSVSPAWNVPDSCHLFQTPCPSHPHEPPLSPEPRPRSSPASETWNALRLLDGRARKSLSYNLATLLSVRNCIWLKAGELLAHPLPAGRDANTTGFL